MSVSRNGICGEEAKSRSASRCYSLTGNLNDHIPHIKGDPLSGQFFKSCFEPSISKIAQRCALVAKQKNTGVAQAFLFFKPYIFISHPSLLQQLIKFNGDKLLDSEAGGVQEKYFGDDNLVSLSRSDSRYSGKRASIMLHLFNHIHHYAQPMQEIIKPYIAEIAAGKAINLVSLSARISMTMISQLQLGFEKFSEEDKDYLAASVHNLIKQITYAPNVALLSLEDLLKHWMSKRIDLTPHLTNSLRGCEKILRKVIKENESKVLEKMKSLLGNDKMSAQELYEPASLGVIKLFLVGGFETTSKLILFSLLMLGNPENAAFLEKMRVEIAQHDKPPQEWTTEDLAKLEYLPAFIYEVLRCYPPFSHQRLSAVSDIKLMQGAPMFGKKADYQSFFNSAYRNDDEDILIPKGSVIVVSPFDAHRHELIYQDAEKFNPERWLGKKFSLRDVLMRSDFFTFGVDNRACPGRLFATQEALLLIPIIAAQFDVNTNLKSTIPVDVGFTLELADKVVATATFTPLAQKVLADEKSPEQKVRFAL